MKTKSFCQVLSAAALALMFGDALLAQCQPGCGCGGSCGCGSCNNGGVSTGLIYQTGYTHWTPTRGMHSQVTPAPQYSPRPFDVRYSNYVYPGQR